MSMSIGSPAMMVRLTLLVLLIVPGVPQILAEDVDPDLLNKFIHGVSVNTSIVDTISVKARLVTTVELRDGTELGRQEINAAGFIPNTPEIKEISTVAISGPYGLKTSMGRDTEAAIEHVTAKNDKYAFRIRRSSPDTGYSIEFLQELGLDPDLDSKIQASYEEGVAF